LSNLRPEAVTSIPMNGGTYNLLLNTTSKFAAALAACLSILSYMATAVVSGIESVLYLQSLIDVFAKGTDGEVYALFSYLILSDYP
jgi:predicted histidine transporter YuiF (NhaC family)